jgi:phospholipid transport system transporter-binding protein
MKIAVDRISNDNAVSLLEQGLAAIRAGDLGFDLSAVTECNSAAVAVVLAWQREAQSRGAKLQLSGLPPNLKSLAQLYDVEALVTGGHPATT